MISIMLTEKQTAMIAEFFDAVDRAYESGNPGMIAGQFFRSDEGEGFMDVGFLDGDKAKEMLRAMGRPEIEARTSCEVYTESSHDLPPTSPPLQPAPHPGAIPGMVRTGAEFGVQG